MIKIYPIQRERNSIASLNINLQTKEVQLKEKLMENAKSQN